VFCFRCLTDSTSYVNCPVEMGSVDDRLIWYWQKGIMTKVLFMVENRRGTSVRENKEPTCTDWIRRLRKELGLGE